jgi:phosphoenolpyruvate-protein kinase (PTS system EI component)
LRLSPPATEIERVRHRKVTGRSARKTSNMRGSDDHDRWKRVAVFANIGGLRDAQQVTELGGEGIGFAL